MTRRPKQDIYKVEFLFTPHDTTSTLQRALPSTLTSCGESSRKLELSHASRSLRGVQMALALTRDLEPIPLQLYSILTHLMSSLKRQAAVVIPSTGCSPCLCQGCLETL